MGENNSSENEGRKEKKIIVYSPIMELYAKAEIPPNVPRNPIIKWYQTNMTYEEKYRFGHITYEEYCAWMYELMNQAQSGGGSGDSTTTADERGTFWHNDQEERTNLSSNDYNDFLSQNNVDISNRSTVDFDKLASEVGAQGAAPAPAPAPVPAPAEAAPTPAASEEVDVNEVLANVNKDIHGGDQMLTQEEIEALFAAAGN